MSDELQDLYQSIILDHNKRPRNFGAIEDADAQADGHNPLCGDELTVYLKLADGRVSEVSFSGEGCAISRASASIMTECLRGKTREEAEAQFRHVMALLTGPEEPESALDRDGELVALLGVRRFPARIKCATLAWHTAEAALHGEGSISTE